MRAENPSHALGLVLADELARNGVTDAVMAPGSRSTAVVMALQAEPRIRLHVHPDERSAGFVALGLGRATGRPAAVVTTSGSATANLHPAVVEADPGRVPLLVLTADRPPELQHAGANQTIQQVGLYGGAVRWAVDLSVPEDRGESNAVWRSTTARAVAVADGRLGPPGPVHLNLPFREPTVPATDDGRSRAAGPFTGPVEGRPARAPWLAVAAPPALPQPATLDALAGLLAGTERGVVVLGDGVGDAGPLLELAAVVGWPVLAEPTSGGRRARREVVSCAHWLLTDAAFAAAHRPEAVLRVGRLTLSRAVARSVAGAPAHVLVDRDGAWLDPERQVTDLVVGDPGAVARALVERLPAAAGSDWLDAWVDAEARARRALDGHLDALGELSEARVARDVVAAVPDGGTLVVGSSLPIRHVDQTMRGRSGLRLLANRGASGIDGFASTALGVALAGTGPTVALCGDLAWLHDRNALLLSPDGADPDAVFVVLDNDGGGLFSLLPQARYPSFERLFATPHGRDLGRLAAAEGLTVTAVTAPGDVVTAVREAVASGGRHLLHVRTDRERTAALAGELERVVGAALA